jgi:hypothetical protein
MVMAHVSKEATLQEDGPGSLRQRIEVETEQIIRGDEHLAVNSGLRINIYQQELLKRDSDQEAIGAPVRVFTYGERLRFPAKISPPSNYRNPGAFDYRGYLQENGSSHWLRPKLEVSRFFPVFPAAGLNSGAPEFIAASSTRSTPCGRLAKPH